MKIQTIKARLLEIPLKVGFRQSNSQSHSSRSVVVELTTENGAVGLGECCPRPYVTGETPATVLADIEGLQSSFSSESFDSLTAIQRFVLDVLPDLCGLSTICALEGALLRAYAAEHGQGFFELFGLKEGGTLTYSGVLPLCKLTDFPKLLQRVQPLAFQEIKLKIGTDLRDTISRMEGVRAVLGEDISIRVDANCSWTFADALEQLPALIEFGVQQFEQLFPTDKTLQLARITEKFGSLTRISVDESFTDLDSATRLLELQACNHFNFKLSKNGGIFHALRIKHLLDRQGYTAQLGAHFGETSLLTAAGIVFAQLAGDLTSLEGAFGTHLLEWDLQEPALQFGVGGVLAF